MLIHRFTRWSYLKRSNSNRWAWLWHLILIPFAPIKLAFKISSKSEIDERIEIDNGVCFSDQGYIMFGARKTGTGTVIGTRVTVGMGHADNGRPMLGRNVWIGSDCVVYGAISIGDGATLLPGTVLSKSIPAGVVMHGNPARLVLRNFDNSELRMLQDADAMQHVAEKWGDLNV
jgi:serine acetyltransferase